MVLQYLQTSAELRDYMYQLSSNQFTGSLLLNADAYLSWTIYFAEGKLFWLNGGNNEQERWNRHLEVFLPHLEQSEWKKYISCPTSADGAEWIFSQLQQNKLLVPQQLSRLISGILIEGLFDVIQYKETAQKGLLLLRRVHKFSFSQLLPFTTEKIFQTAMLSWHGWQNAGLAPISPNLFPVIEQPELLKEETCPWIYQLVKNEVDGARTLRQISCKSYQDVLSLTKFVLPLVELGALSFASVPTIKRFKLPESKLMSNKLVATGAIARRVPSFDNSPLVALVDDSSTFCQIVKKILAPPGYRFLAVREPLKAVVTLLENKPDLIFLDLIMPNYNGYELCVQLRKVKAFKKVPIIFLTSQDGIVNRGKAALVGATGFLSKPVTPRSLLGVVAKHLNNSSLIKFRLSSSQ